MRGRRSKQDKRQMKERQAEGESSREKEQNQLMNK